MLFKSSEQGRAAWQGETLHGVWFDEEPPRWTSNMEGLTRTNATGGIVMVTFTLKGISDVVRLFLADEEVQALG